MCSLPYVTMTSTFSRTKSVTMSAERSLRPSAQRRSILMVRSSIQPSSRSRCAKATTHAPAVIGVPEPRKPMVGTFADCCAWAASGHPVAAPPSSDCGSPGDNDIDLQPDELGRDLGVAFGAPLRPAIFDRDGAALAPAEFV